MNNVVTERKGDMLILKIDLSKEGKPSASGKTVVIGGTSGFKQIPGTDFSINLNVTKPKND